MQFSNQSQEYVEFIYNTFKSCMLDKEINPNSNSIETTFFKNLFEQLKQSEAYITSKRIQNNITKQYINIENTKQIYYPSVYNTNFFPEVIKKGIELNTIKGIIYNTKLDERKIDFYFYTQDTSIPRSTFDTYINYMLMWIYILNLYGNNTSCSQHLNIFIFLTDFKKKIPQNPITILAQEHVNTAYTLVCTPKSEIVIYRKE